MTHAWSRIRIALTAALALAVVVVSGARAQTPPAEKPSAAAAADTIRFHGATPGESLIAFPSNPIPGERWSLVRCIQTALKQNTDVLSASAVTKQASGSALSAWSGIIPSLRAGLSYTYSIPDKSSSFSSAEIDTSGGAGAPPAEVIGQANTDKFSSVDASLTSNIISAPAIQEKKRRDHLHTSSRFGEIETRNLVVYQVKQQYFELLKAERLSEVAHETERLARDEETRADALFQVGTVARGDVLKARARRATTQADRIRADNQVDIQSARLKQILGVDVTDRILAESIQDQALVLPDSSESIRRALVERPRLESAKATERAARSGLSGAKTERLPAITGSIDFRRSRFQETLENLTGVPNPPDEVDVERYATEWQGTVRASMPIFDGLAIEGGIRQAKGALLEAEAQRRQRELDVTYEVQSAWLTLREAVARIEVAREGLASAEEDYKFSQGRYQLGAGTYLDLLTAEVGLANARQTLVEAIATARVAEAGLEYSVGATRY
jgi:outer membrane protein TolC